MATCSFGHESAGTDFCDACGIRIGAPVPAPAPWPLEAPSPGAGQAQAGPCPNCGITRSGQFCEACGFDFRSGRFPGRHSTAAPAAPGQGPPTVAAPVNRSPSGWPAPTGSTPAPRPPAQRPPASRPPGFGPPTSSPAAPGPAAPAAPPRRPGASAPAVPEAPTDPFIPAWSVLVTADRSYYETVVATGAPDAAAITFPDYWSERRFQLAGSQMRIGRVSRSRGFAPEIDLTGPPTDPGVSRLHAVLIPEPDGSWAILDPGSENGTLVNDIEIAIDQRVRLRNGDRVHLGAWTALTIQAG